MIKVICLVKKKKDHDSEKTLKIIEGIQEKINENSDGYGLSLAWHGNPDVQNMSLIPVEKLCSMQNSGNLGSQYEIHTLEIHENHVTDELY